MVTSYRVSPMGHLLLAIASLEFAKEQPAVGAETRRKVALALASARRDLAKLKGKAQRRLRKTKRR
jgi:hypothetical protein